MITELITDFKTKFEEELSIYFLEKIEYAKKSKEISVDMLESLKEFTLRGGKRIRPALVYYGYLCFNDQNLDEVLKAGITVELIQTALLVHDDIIDKDDLRRNKPTLHKIYSDQFKDKHIGNSLAIIAGDLALSLANENLLKLDFENNKKIKACLVVNDILNKVEYGQELDIISTKNKDTTESHISLIHKLKTGKYTFEGPLKIGATLAGANEEDMITLESISYFMGQAFQIQDDILGLFSDTKKIGKPIGSDIREGKKTLLIIKALKEAIEEDKNYLENIIGKKELSIDEIENVKEIIIKTGSLNYSKKKAEQFIENAEEIIINSSFNDTGKNFLIKLAKYIKNRTY